MDHIQPLKGFWLRLIEMESVAHKRSDPDSDLDPPPSRAGVKAISTSLQYRGWAVEKYPKCLNPLLLG